MSWLPAAASDPFLESLQVMSSLGLNFGDLAQRGPEAACRLGGSSGMPSRSEDQSAKRKLANGKSINAGSVRTPNLNARSPLLSRPWLLWHRRQGNPRTRQLRSFLSVNLRSMPKVPPRLPLCCLPRLRRSHEFPASRTAPSTSGNP